MYMTNRLMSSWCVFPPKASFLQREQRRLTVPLLSAAGVWLLLAELVDASCRKNTTCTVTTLHYILYIWQGTFDVGHAWQLRNWAHPSNDSVSSKRALVLLITVAAPTDKSVPNSAYAADCVVPDRLRKAPWHNGWKTEDWLVSSWNCSNDREVLKWHIGCAGNAEWEAADSAWLCKLGSPACCHVPDMPRAEI